MKEKTTLVRKLLTLTENPIAESNQKAKSCHFVPLEPARNERVQIAAGIGDFLEMIVGEQKLGSRLVACVACGCRPSQLLEGLFL